MKNTVKLAILILLLTFINCKHETKKNDDLIPKDTPTEVTKEIDTIIRIENTDPVIEKIPEIASPKIATPKSPEKAAPKIEDKTNTTQKEEVPVKQQIEQTTQIEKEIAPINEKVIETEIKTITEPIIEKPKNTSTLSTWKVPAQYQTMKNPVAPATDASIGKSLYTKHCKSCHGAKGLGDGPKAAEMDGDLGDFSSKEFQAQSDGALFYKTTIGRDDMPEFTKKLPNDEDRWLIVNYMRTLKK